MRKLLIVLLVTFNANSVFAGAAAGGASEVTQIANNVELVMNVAENARQTTVQMNQLYTSLQNIQGMGGLSNIERQMGLPPGSLTQSARNLGSVKKLYDTVDQMRSSSSSLEDKAKNLTAVYKAALETYKKTGVTPSEMLEEVKNMKGEEARVHQERVRNIQRQQDGIVDDMDKLKEQSRGVESITGNVKGFQYLATQNIEVQRAMKENSLLITQSMAMREQEKEELAKKEREEEERKAAIEKADRERFKQVTTMDKNAWREAMQGAYE